MWLDFALGIMDAAAWPTVVMTAIVVFRTELRNVLTRLKSASALGIEAKFLERVLEDPESSEETKDAIAEVLRDVSTATGNPIPRQAADQLDASRRRRGRPAGSSILKAISAKDYQRQVRAAFERVSEDQLKFGQEATSLGMAGVVVPELSVRPQHGVGSWSVLVRQNPKNDESLAALQNDRRDLIVVSPGPDSVPNVQNIHWQSEADDEILASKLEELGLFDYVETSSNN